MKYVRLLALSFAVTGILTASIAGQQVSPLRKDEIVWAQDFLRALYPALNGKSYGLSVETYLAYDQPGKRASSLQMNIGEGPKDLVLGHIGGCLYSVSPSPPGWPKELGPQPPPVITPSFEGPCRPGPITPKQFLTAGFQFDEEGYLTTFGADGPFINDGKAHNEVYQIVHAHPATTYAEMVAILKQHGTKYGPDDKEQFVKDLPLKQLESFLGKLRVVSVGFTEIDSAPNPTDWLGVWPDWTVKVQATTKDGTKVPYELHFSHLNGYLTGQLDCRTSPWCHKD